MSVENTEKKIKINKATSFHVKKGKFLDGFAVLMKT